MRNAVRTWSSEHLTGEAVLAVGGGFSDGEIFTGFVAPEFVLAHNEEIWRQLGVTIAKMRGLGLPLEDLVWRFEDAMVCSACREEGAWLAVFVGLENANHAIENVRSRLEEFRKGTFEAAD